MTGVVNLRAKTSWQMQKTLNEFLQQQFTSPNIVLQLRIPKKFRDVNEQQVQQARTQIRQAVGRFGQTFLRYDANQKKALEAQYNHTEFMRDLLKNDLIDNSICNGERLIEKSLYQPPEDDCGMYKQLQRNLKTKFEELKKKYDYSRRLKQQFYTDYDTLRYEILQFRKAIVNTNQPDEKEAMPLSYSPLLTFVCENKYRLYPKDLQVIDKTYPEQYVFPEIAGYLERFGRFLARNNPVAKLLLSPPPSVNVIDPVSQKEMVKFVKMLNPTVHDRTLSKLLCSLPFADLRHADQCVDAAMQTDIMFSANQQPKTCIALQYANCAAIDHFHRMHQITVDLHQQFLVARKTIGGMNDLRSRLASAYYDFQDTMNAAGQYAKTIVSKNPSLPPSDFNPRINLKKNYIPVMQGVYLYKNTLSAMLFYHEPSKLHYVPKYGTFYALYSPTEDTGRYRYEKSLYYNSSSGLFQIYVNGAYIDLQNTDGTIDTRLSYRNREFLLDGTKYTERSLVWHKNLYYLKIDSVSGNTNLCSLLPSSARYMYYARQQMYDAYFQPITDNYLVDCANIAAFLKEEKVQPSKGKPYIHTDRMVSSIIANRFYRTDQDGKIFYDRETAWLLDLNSRRILTSNDGEFFTFDLRIYLNIQGQRFVMRGNKYMRITPDLEQEIQYWERVVKQQLTPAWTKWEKSTDTFFIRVPTVYDAMSLLRRYGSSDIYMDESHGIFQGADEYEYLAYWKRTGRWYPVRNIQDQPYVKLNETNNKIELLLEIETGQEVFYSNGALVPKTPFAQRLVDALGNANVCVSGTAPSKNWHLLSYRDYAYDAFTGLYKHKTDNRFYNPSKGCYLTVDEN